MDSEVPIKFSFVDSSARLKISYAFGRLGTVSPVMVLGRVGKCNYFLFSHFLQSNNFLLIFYFPTTWLPREEKQSGVIPQTICPSPVTVSAEHYFIELGQYPQIAAILLPFPCSLTPLRCSSEKLWEGAEVSHLPDCKIQWWIEAHTGKVVYPAMSEGLAVPFPQQLVAWLSAGRASCSLANR